MKSESKKILSAKHHDIPLQEQAVERERVKKAIHIYNNLLYSSEVRYREEIIKGLFGSIGNNFNIEKPFFCDYGRNIHIGENFYANTGCTFQDITNIEIGDNVMLGPNVGIYTTGHPSDISGDDDAIAPVTIGDNVWVGGSVVILPGVTIGDDAFILAGSIVVKDIPANAMVSGNPARIVKYIEEYAEDED